MSEYKLVRKIGTGGMGAVWYGIRQSDGAECAIKCLHAQYVSIPDYREFFDSEARALKRLNHPSVVKIMGDTFTDIEGNLYLPMEFVPGDTIEQRVKQTCSPFSVDEAIHIMCDILDAFSYIHSQGQIHRDIKPSNIMLRPDGRICVIDFGIAKDMKTNTGKTIGRQVGTHGYMSPEQIDALNIDHRTDIYSLGCLLFYMLAARHAITKRSNDYETMYAIQRDAFPSVRAFNPSVPKRVEDIIYKATNKDMRRRFQTAEEFKVALLNDTTSIIPVNRPNTVASRSMLDKVVGHWIVTVGRAGQDINIPNKYVSSRHLNIDLSASYSTELRGVNRLLTLTDHSTNGTGIDGKYIHNVTEIIPIDILDENSMQVPDILLAGREECRLEWQSVVQAMIAKMSQDIKFSIPDSTQELESTQVKEQEVTQSNTEESSYIAIVIISFLFPIIGGLIYIINRSNKSVKAQKAIKAAWWGFVVGVILKFIISNI